MVSEQALPQDLSKYNLKIKKNECKMIYNFIIYFNKFHFDILITTVVVIVVFIETILIFFISAFNIYYFNNNINLNLFHFFRNCCRFCNFLSPIQK